MNIVISLLMATGSFSSDTKRAEKRLQEFEKQVAKTASAIAVGFTAAVATAVYAFDRLAKGASVFQDLAEMTGTTAQDLASFAVAAETAGVSMDSVAGSINLMTKNLTGVDDESKAAGAAISALGLEIKEFKKLDPAAQYEAIGKALAGFADGGEKSAVAMAIFGRAGAEQLKVFKALEEQGGRTTILTQQQITQADAYADAQARTTAEIKLYAQAAAATASGPINDLLTAFKDLLGEMIGVDKATGKLAAENGIREFAEDGVLAVGILAESLIGIAKLVRAIGGSIQVAAADLNVLKAAAKMPNANPFSIGFAAGSGLGNDELKTALADRNKTLAEANQRYEDLWKKSGTTVTDSLRKSFAERKRLEDSDEARENERFKRQVIAGAGGIIGSRPRLPFDGPDKPGKKAPVDEIAKSMAALNKELALFGQSDMDKRLLEFRLMGASAKEVNEFRGALENLNALKVHEDIEKTIEALLDEVRVLSSSTEQITLNKLARDGASQSQLDYAKSILEATKAAREEKKVEEEIKQLFEATRTPTEQYGAEIERLNKLKQQGRLDAELYARGIDQAVAALDRATEATKAVAEETDTFTKRLQENVQDTLGSGLYDAMSGNFSNIGQSFVNMVNRMVAEALAADLARKLFGDNGGGGGGGWMDILFSIGASLFGGGGGSGGIGGGSFSTTGAMIHGRHADGLDFVPFDGYRAELHRGEKVLTAQEAKGGGRNIIVNVTAQRGMSRDSAMQQGVTIGLGIQRAMARDT